jgi:biopolymer transport protein ExbB
VTALIHWIEWIANIGFTVALGGSSILALAVILERFDAYRRAGAASASFLAELRRRLESAPIEEALLYCEVTAGPSAAVAAAGIRRCREMTGARAGATLDPETFHRIEQKVNEAMREKGDREVSRLEEHLPLLSTLGTVAPLIGFLGTVAGMIIAFENIAAAGMGKPQVVAGGISTALVTTAAGLIIAIPAFAAHNYFANRVKVFVEEMDETASMVVHMLVTR